MTQTTDQPAPTAAYLGLGSNLGDRRGQLLAACAALATLPGTLDIEQSPIYETPPMGPQDQGPYLNMAVRLDTTRSAKALLSAMQQIESGLGRASTEHRAHWGPREIDLDLLLFGERIIDQPGLTVPHPGIAERWFVLKPLADLNPNLRHPTLKKTIAELLEKLESRDGVPGLISSRGAS